MSRNHPDPIDTVEPCNEQCKCFRVVAAAGGGLLILHTSKNAIMQITSYPQGWEGCPNDYKEMIFNCVREAVQMEIETRRQLTLFDLLKYR